MLTIIQLVFGVYRQLQVLFAFVFQHVRRLLRPKSSPADPWRSTPKRNPSLFPDAMSMNIY